MLLHICPRFLLTNGAWPVELIDLRLQPFGLMLRGGVDLAVRRPYPNKRYLVACRKVGRKAIDGLLVETGGPLTGWSSIARWAIAAERVLTHRVEVTLLDSDSDAVSENMLLWPRERMPAHLRGIPPVTAQPCMSNDIPGDHRIQRLRIPTIPRARLTAREVDDRLPEMADAFYL